MKERRGSDFKQIYQQESKSSEGESLPAIGAHKSDPRQSAMEIKLYTEDERTSSGIPSSCVRISG